MIVTASKKTSILAILAGFFAVFAISSMAFASEEGGIMVHFISYYDILLSSLGVPEAMIENWVVVPGALLTLVICLSFGVYYKRRVEKLLASPAPSEKFSLMTAIETMMDIVYGVAKDTCGHRYRNFLPLLAGIFFFIIISNLCGLVPGFLPPTESISTNLALGLIVFLVYNGAGIKEHGFHYIKQFMGPFIWIAPLFMGIELVSHAARPFSLGIRLMANVMGDHLMLSVFTGLTYVVVPGLLLFFGLIVACVQSFVFMLLSGIYVSLAISHDH